MRGLWDNQSPFSDIDTSQLRVIWGHISFGIGELLDFPTTYVTFVREPVARVVSVHRYIVENPKHPLHEPVSGMSLEEFVTSEIDDVDVTNGQTRQLFGIADRVPDQEMLDDAKRNLKVDFAFVGITERFDESVLLLRAALGWPLPFYRVQNATTSAENRLSPEVRRLIKSRNALDQELYGFAVDLLNERVAKEGSLFPARLAAFKALNGIARAYRGARDLRPRRRSKT